MYEQLKKRVLEANLLLPEFGLVDLTWGNVSEVDRENGVVAIKPSGVPYETMTENYIVVVGLKDGKIVDGELNPSSDLNTHLVLYKAFSNIGGVCTRIRVTPRRLLSSMRAFRHSERRTSTIFTAISPARENSPTTKLTANTNTTQDW